MNGKLEKNGQFFQDILYLTLFTAVKITIISWVLNFRVRMLLKGVQQIYSNTTINFFSFFSVRLTELYVGDRRALQDPFVQITTRMVLCAGKHAEPHAFVKYGQNVLH